MCDSFIALHASTGSGNILMSKNSDREPDEAQGILHMPARRNPEEYVRCTFIEIPQVQESFETILSNPFQMWGAEMGMNEWGLAIGNEAVFTKFRFEKKNLGLTGMDMVRLALERSKTADDAIRCITSLLATYGQDACGGYRNKGFYYHNSFLISDKESGWVLETAGREWAIERVTAIRSISNKLSISEPAAMSLTAQSTAASKGWSVDKDPFDFALAYSDWLYTRVGRAATRAACTSGLAMQTNGQLTAHDCMQILQTHNLPDRTFKPSKANTGSVCMHATSFLNPSQTTGSMVAEIRRDRQSTIWLSGTARPCLSVYIPFFIGTSTLTNFMQPTAEPDGSIWWKAERLHRWICKDYQKRKALINEERLALQQTILDGEQALFKAKPSSASLGEYSNRCLQQCHAAINKWSLLIAAK